MFSNLALCSVVGAVGVAVSFSARDSLLGASGDLQTSSEYEDLERERAEEVEMSLPKGTVFTLNSKPNCNTNSLKRVMIWVSMGYYGDICLIPVCYLNSSTGHMYDISSGHVSHMFVWGHIYNLPKKCSFVTVIFLFNTFHFDVCVTSRERMAISTVCCICLTL